MWDEENSAETVTIHPWAGASQPQSWQGMNRGGSNNTFSTNNRGNQQLQQRSWDSLQQQQQQMLPHSSGWTPQMTWNPMASLNQPSNNWFSQQQQQWPSSNSSSGTYAEKAKNSSGTINRMSGGSLTANSSRFDQMSSSGTTNWASGSVKVDQHTPWNTTGSGGHSHNTDSREWNAGLSNNGPGASGATRWGQPALVGIPSGAPNVWPHSGVVNTSNIISSAGNATEWSSNPAIIASVQNAHRIPPQHDITGTAHWSAGAPPPAVLMGNGAVVPPVSCGSSSNWCQPGIGGTCPTGSDIINRLSYDPNPQTPGPWVAPQPAEMNNDMMWHDPNPKQKKIQRDIGTSIWGDPSNQPEIRRWKDADEVAEYSALPNGSDWSDLPLNVSASVGGNNFCGIPTSVTANNNDNVIASVNPTNIISSSNTVSSTVTGSGWGEPTQPNNSNIDIGTSRWSNNENLSNNNETGLIWPTQQSEKNNEVMSADLLIQAAVSRNLINVSIFSSGVSATNPHALLDLTNLLQRYFSKERELNKIQQLNKAQLKNEEERLICEIKNVKSELAEIQCKMSNSVSISASNIPNGSYNNGSLPQDGQSRLQQWKKTNNLNSNINANNNIVDTNSDLNSGNMQTILAVTQTLSIYSPNNSTGGLDDKNSSDWKSGTLDWSAPSTIASGEGFEQKGTSSSTNNTNFNGGENSSENTTTSVEQNTLVDDGPPEFVPGKKWEWRDPNKVAEDPNATPGTCKPNPLLASALQHTVAGTFSTSVVTASTSNNDISKAWSNNLTNANVSTEMWNKHRISSINAPPPPINRMLNGIPPPNMINFNSTNRQFSPAYNGFWFLFHIINFNDHQIVQLCSRVGRLLQFLVVGQKFACVKFAEPNIEVILQRLKPECINLQLQFKLASDEEFDKIIRVNITNNVQIVNRFPFINNNNNNNNETQQQQHWANDIISMVPPPLSHFNAGNDFSSGIPF